MTNEILYMVFDVESVGLHGEGFAVGYVVIDGAGKELEAGFYRTKIDNAQGRGEGREWVKENVQPALEQNTPYQFTDGMGSADPRQVRERFWEKWIGWKGRGARLAADVAWPVEARFLCQCIDDDPVRRSWDGPYPLIDVASVRLAKGLDPLATVDRGEWESPQHHPTADARQSARLLIESLSA